MQAYKTHQKITEDRHVTLTVPDEFPIGEAEIIVLAQVPEAVRVGQRESLESFFRKLDSTPPSGRSKEDIDRYLEEERASWER